MIGYRQYSSEKEIVKLKHFQRQVAQTTNIQQIGLYEYFTQHLIPAIHPLFPLKKKLVTALNNLNSKQQSQYKL